MIKTHFKTYHWQNVRYILTLEYKFILIINIERMSILEFAISAIKCLWCMWTVICIYVFISVGVTCSITDGSLVY